MDPKNHKLKYPKLLLLIFTVIIAIKIFYEGKNYAPFHELLVSTGYIGTFVSGIFYAFGFTSSPATAVLLILAKEQNLLISLLTAGFGALLSDALIFLFVRFTFMDEIEKLQKEKIMKNIRKDEKIIFGHYYKYIFPTIAGFLIASPLPTEIGVSMMATLKKMSFVKFLLITYLLHTIGIFIILVVGNLI